MFSAITGIMLVAAVLNLSALWDYDQPALSEKRFREALTQCSNTNEALEVQTQIARALSMQRRFEEAHQTLDAVEPLATNSPQIQVRYLLERGRVFNSSGKPEQSLPLFKQAWEKAQAAQLDFFSVDAAHMLGIVMPPDEALRWNERAVALAEKSGDPKAKGWLGALYNNIGWTYYDKHEFATALDYFQRDFKWYAEHHLEKQAFIARYSIGKAQRALGRFDEALKLQRELRQEMEAKKQPPDGYVLEEIAECLLALNKTTEAKPFFARAYELLSYDDSFPTKESPRLERLHKLSQ